MQFKKLLFTLAIVLFLPALASAYNWDDFDDLNNWDITGSAAIHPYGQNDSTGAWLPVGARLENHSLPLNTSGVFLVEYWVHANTSIDDGLQQSYYVAGGTATGCFYLNPGHPTDNTWGYYNGGSWTSLGVSSNSGRGDIQGGDWAQVRLLIDNVNGKISVRIGEGQSTDDLTNASYVAGCSDIGSVKFAAGNIETGYFDTMDVCDVDGYSWNCTGAAPPPPPPGSMNLTNANPTSGTDFNDQNISFNVTGDFTNSTTCLLYLNGTLNETQTSLGPGDDVPVNFSHRWIEEGTHHYEIACSNVAANATTGNITFYVDVSLPTLEDDFINNSMYFNTNLTTQINVSDNIILSRINVTIDGTEIYSQALSAATFQVNISYNVSGYAIGNHTLMIEAADGHTRKELKDPDGYKHKTNFWNDMLIYEIGGTEYEEIVIWVKHLDGSYFDDWQVEQRIDRFSETFTPSRKDTKQEFRVSSSQPIRIIKDPKGHFGGEWLIMGDHWKDFVIRNQPDAKVKYKRVDDHSVDVIITGLDPEKPLIFDSTGDLNVITKYYDFYRINLTTAYDPTVFVGYQYDFNLTVDFGNLLFNISGYDSAALFENDAKNYTATQLAFNNSGAEYTVIFADSYNESQTGVIPFNWHFNVTNLTRPDYINFGEQNYTRSPVQVGICNGSIIYPIMNVTYKDELTDDQINVTNAYQLKIYDGTYYYNQTSFFNETNNHTLCTNIDPALATYNWNMWGTMTLTKSGYVTRIISIDEATPYSISNNPMSSLEYFMIGTANSTTMTYNWLTTNFELIQGTMRIYRCLENGSKDLVESVPVISGVSYANIQLLLQPYSYDITIDGTTYEDEDGFSLCHTEAATEVTYYVDVSEIDLSALIGLTNIDCNLNKVGNDTVNMNWDVNPEDSSYVSGCILGYRRQLGGLVEVYNNCSVEADGYNRSVQIPINNQEYIIRAELRQGANAVACDEEVSFFVGRAASELFSLTGLFGALLLIIGISLMYAGKATQQLIGAGVGLVAAFVLALINVSWITIASFLLILIIVGIVGRMSRLEL